MSSLPRVPANVKVLSVGEITRTIRELLEESFANVWIAGEISNMSRPSSGHLYFKLKDSEAMLGAVMWRSTALRLRFDLRDGMDVIARGKLSLYAPRGEYQFMIEELQPKGIGAAELALQQLKKKLFELGWFDRNRKKALPRFPRRIALVTSPTGAAVRDMLGILTQRWPLAHVVVCPARMQGDGAAQEIADAVRLLNRLHQQVNARIDVVILGRGGGTSEDLGAFNDELVAHAIFHSVIPVVSAIGHEIDVTIADLVADRRALTPSEAATAVAPDRRELLLGLAEVEDRMRQALVNGVAQQRRRLDDLLARRIFKRPLEQVRVHEQRLDDWAARLDRAIRQRLTLGRERVEAFAGQLASLSPLNVLARGYSLTKQEADGTVVRDAQQVRLGDRLVTILERGAVVSRVEAIPLDEPLRDAREGSSTARMQP